MREQVIHRAVWQHVDARLVANAFAYHVPNGGARSKVEAAIFSGLGVVPGVPDLILIHDGHTFGLEIKCDGGRVSDDQRQVHDRMQAAGATVAVAFGLDAALHQLEQWGLLRGHAT
jgi:hypothetical protein